MKVRVVTALILSIAALVAVRRAVADLLYRAGEAAHASQLEPTNVDYLLERSDQPADVDLERAIRLEPGRAAARMELAMRAELAGNMVAAEAQFRKAAGASRQYDVLWALASFYFRRGDREEFLLWSRRAATAAYGDDGQLFALCTQMLDKPSDVLHHCVSDNPAQLRRYLAYLRANNPVADAVPAAIRLAAAGRAIDRDELLDFCDRLLISRMPEAAIKVWNTAVRGGLVPHEPVAQTQVGLVNASFRHPILSRGFDWRTNLAAGVRVFAGESPGEVHVALDGSEADDVVALSQLIPLRGPARVRLTYQVEGRPVDMGWAVFDEPSTREIGSRRMLMEGAHTCEVVIPAATKMIRLTLTYRRQPGEGKFDGEIKIGGLKLQKID